MTKEDLEKLRAGIANRCQPSVRGVTFTFRALTIAEQCTVTSSTVQRVQKLPAHEQHSQNESRINAVLTLQAASNLDPSGWNPQVLESTLELLTADELGFLFSQYTHFLSEINPALEEIPRDQILELIEELKKKPSRAIELSSLQLINLVRYWATKPDSPPAK